MFISNGIKEFCEQMVNNPNDWVQGEYEFTNKKHPDIAIWTCNGVCYIKIGRDETLNFFEKRIIAKAIKQTKANQLKTNPE